MKKSVKVALATTALAAAGGLFLVGSSLAERGPGGPMGHMGMMGGLGHEMLQNVDTDNDGALSQEEINSAVNARFAQFDADKNGDLSLTEFQALWADITRPIAVRAFQFLDPNGDAAIAKAELDNRFGNLVSHLDRNDDGKLSPDDRMGRHGGHRGWGHGWRGEGPQDNKPDNE